MSDSINHNSDISGKKICCIGSGNMGMALMKGAVSIAGPACVGFTDIDKTKAQSTAAAIGGSVYGSNTEAAAAADFLFLAVKPQVLDSVLNEIIPVIKEKLKSGNPPLLVSMAAGWSIEKIQSCLGVKAPVARIMPNTPALISRGIIALALSPEVSPDSGQNLEKILKPSGQIVRLEEKYFDAVTGLSGSGPAYVYMFIEALADGGVQAGLPRDKALQLAAATVAGSAAMVAETGRHPGELKDAVASPGGTTIAGIAALEKGCFRGTVMGAVEAAWRRAVELG
ncbi:MAG: pyrroline-5-carboxylate reductase [Treponema sp.]|nr:pyrroline-5-carboxylate reductase [Treponema sp.]